jgi:transposase
MAYILIEGGLLLAIVFGAQNNMKRKFTLNLSRENRLRLQHIMDRGTNWRERERAKTLILLDSALSMQEVADVIGVNVRTVGSTRLAWLEHGVDSLADLPRSGAPKKISQQQVENLLILADAEPMSARQLLAKHMEDGGAPVHLNTLTGALKAAGLVWKRTRHSLKKKEMKLPSGSRKVRSACCELGRRPGRSSWDMQMKQVSHKRTQIEAHGHEQENAI